MEEVIARMPWLENRREITPLNRESAIVNA